MSSLPTELTNVLDSLFFFNCIFWRCQDLSWSSHEAPGGGCHWEVRRMAVTCHGPVSLARQTRHAQRHGGVQVPRWIAWEFGKVILVNAKSDCRFLNFCGLQTHLNHHSVVIPMPYFFYRRKTGQWLQKMVRHVDQFRQNYSFGRKRIGVKQSFIN